MIIDRQLERALGLQLESYTLGTRGPWLAELFDSLSGYAGRGAVRRMQPRFEMIAAPGARLHEAVVPGDLLLRRGLAEGGVSYASIIDGEPVDTRDLEPSALRLDRAYDGVWIPVIENANASGPVYRQLADVSGRVPLYQLVARPRGLEARVHQVPASFAFDYSSEPTDSGEPLYEQATPVGPQASPCDLAQTSERLDEFAFDSATLTARHDLRVRAIATCINATQASGRPVRTIRIVGFTDAAGSDAHNDALGTRRAEAVRDALIRELNRLSAGLGASMTFDLDTRGKREQIPGGPGRNRRAEVSVPIAITNIVVHTSDTDTHEIASVLAAGGLEHFCTVKGKGDIVLEAQVTPAIPGSASRIRWEATGTRITSPGVGTDQRTAKLSSSASGKFPIRVKLDGTVVRQAVVWVIWSRITVTATRQPAVAPGNVATNDGTNGPGMNIVAGIDHTFTIEPATIITDADRPALNGANTAAVPGAALIHVVSGATLAAGADRCWDASRQIRAKILNPRLIPLAQLDVVGGHFWTGQPIASTIPENYPAPEALGNDDTTTTDETNDPYTNGGAVTGSDNPVSPMRHSSGADGDTFEVRMHFREFMRVNLLDRWYRASDYSLWRVHARIRRVAGAWVNNGSVIARDNNGF